SLSSLVAVATRSHQNRQPPGFAARLASPSSPLSLRRCRCERRDISENPEPWQALCENILKRAKKGPRRERAKIHGTGHMEETHSLYPGLHRRRNQ
ncbi:hypothetical protein, partial [Pandoraea apista]|uniref:hypothetical protein n=1 Tax=Pandoraea apista TaxID=93218 RepID=UPI001C8B2E7B